MRILVDTNLITPLAQPTHQHHKTAQTAVENIRARNDDLCIVPQVIYEFWVVATRPVSPERGLGMSGTRANKEIGTIRKLFTLLDDTPGLFQEWHRLVVQYDVHGRPAHDARFVAAMIQLGITHILTFNAKDFRRYSEITVLCPDQVTRPPGQD